MPRPHEQFPLPDLQYHRELARRLLADHAAGDPRAAARFRAYHERFQGVDDADILAAEVEMGDAQAVVAAEARLGTWSDLQRYLEGVQDSSAEDARRFETVAEAVVDGDKDSVAKALEAAPDLARARSPRPHHATLLHYVAANGVEDHRQRTPANAVEISDLLIDAGADINATADMYGGGGGSTPLVALVTSVHPHEAGLQADLVRSFARSGGNLNGVDDDGAPMAHAFLFRYPGAAHALAECGARVDDVALAAGLGRLDRVRELLVTEAPPRAEPRAFQGLFGLALDEATAVAMALYTASVAGEVDVARYLLALGVEPDTSFHHGLRALHEACFGGHLEVVRALVEGGADVHVVERQHGGTPRGWAEHAGRDEVVAYLDARVADR